MPEQRIKAIQVSASEPVSKQIVIREHDPATGKIITYVFESSFEKEKWTAEPVVRAIENRADTCNESNDSEIKEFKAEQ